MEPSTRFNISSAEAKIKMLFFLDLVIGGGATALLDYFHSMNGPFALVMTTILTWLISFTRTWATTQGDALHDLPPKV